MTVTTDAAAFARTSGPIQRTSWRTEAYCWTCTAASPASERTPSAYAAAAPASPRSTVSDRRGRASVARTAPRPLPGDDVPGGRQGKPPASEHVQALAVGVAGLLVGRVEVERVAVVGDLRLAVGTRGRSDLGSRHGGSYYGLAGDAGRRPSRGAGAGALTCCSDVLPEQVQRAARRVDEDLAEVALVRQSDRCDLTARGLGHRACGATAAATGADRQRGQGNCCRGGNSTNACVASHGLKVGAGSACSSRMGDRAVVTADRQGRRPTAVPMKSQPRGRRATCGAAAARDDRDPRPEGLWQRRTRSSVPSGESTTRRAIAMR